MSRLFTENSEKLTDKTIFPANFPDFFQAYFIAEVFQRRELPQEFRSKRRLLGRYTLESAPSDDTYQLETFNEKPPQPPVLIFRTFRLCNQGHSHDLGLGEQKGGGGGRSMLELKKSPFIQLKTENFWNGPNF